MQRIEIPKGSKVTIENRVILIEPAKWEPTVGELMQVNSMLLAALANAGYQYNEETNEVEKIRWKPKWGDIYWTFNSNAVFKSTCNTNDLDIERINNGFAFKTESEVREFFDKIKQLANENR